MSKRCYVLAVLAAAALVGAVSFLRPKEPPPEPSSLVGKTEEEVRAKLGAPYHAVEFRGRHVLEYDRAARRPGDKPLVLYFDESGRCVKVTSEGIPAD